MKRGVLLLNFGGPWTLQDVKPFLYRLFSDPAVLVGIPTPLRQALALMIAQLKAPASIQGYEAIGGGSPQLRWTECQASGLQRLLDPSTHRVEIGMRVSSPTIASALERLKGWGAEALTVLPLFPQFSTTTTGTCLAEVNTSLRAMRWSPRVHEIKSWSDQSDYVSLLRTTVEEQVERADQDRVRDGNPNSSVHLLFSARSLPLKIVRRGDPYPLEIDRTFRSVRANLKVKSDMNLSLCFQSRNGRMPWLEPYTEDEISRLGRSGVRRVIIAPISFVSDHIETLWELDQLYAGLAKKSGITHYYRTRAFNDDPEFSKVLRKLIQERVV